ncbi:acyltransferase [Clostridium botulinum]|uniref:acyltransferase family protein n=1 Tax=Clostridium TaxID=1485 RepID=UPI0013F7B48A|nr:MULTISPECIES: acyltransferase family protein [Clostridium]MCS6130344.1 acyltransferase [Clostridium botulinum]NFL45471.1 acyltransferase [Clostridium botulinum]NFL90829.1 acyltransferase [Clostridium botulinum]
MKRVEYLDVAKGILIITVVLCHSSFKLGYVTYWFHMPAFFIISGLLYKDKFNFKKQAIKFFVPYVAFTFLDILIGFLTSPDEASIANFILYFNRHVLSGKFIPGAFWFIPCLFLTKAIFAFLKRYLKDVYIGIIAIALYIFAHVYSMEIIPANVAEITKDLWIPWNIDALLITIPYYALGYFSKNYIEIFTTKKAFKKSLIFAIIFVVLNFALDIDYFLNIKFSEFKFILLDLVVPIGFTVLIFSLSTNYIKGNTKKILALIGERTLIIMYLHRPIANFFDAYFSIDFIIYTIIGVTIPCVITKYIRKKELLAFIFEGKEKRKAK